MPELRGDLATFDYANDSYKENYRPPINTSWLNTSLTYWVGVRWDKWFWKSPGRLHSIFVKVVLFRSNEVNGIILMRTRSIIVTVIKNL